MSAKCLNCEIIFDISTPENKTFYQVLEEIVDLEKGVEISGLSMDSSSVTTLTISFSPPNPSTVINSNPSILNAEITISNGIRPKSVKINNAGRIQIEL